MFLYIHDADRSSTVIDNQRASSTSRVNVFLPIGVHQDNLKEVCSKAEKRDTSEARSVSLGQVGSGST